MKKKSLDNSLLILGNGFHLAHNLKTSYGDFRCYLSKSDIKEFCQLKTLLEFLTPGINLWNDFETALGKMDDARVAKFITAYDKIETQNRYNQKEYISFENAIETLREYLTDAFESWFKTIVMTDCKPLVNIKGIEAIKAISFNYLPLLETVYHVKDVLHIHGEISRSPDERSFLIFGHGISDSNNINDIYDKSELDDAVVKLRQEFKKELQEKELRDYLDKTPDIENIIVLGHSLSEIDLPYFGIINAAFPKANWHVSYHKPDDSAKSNEIVKTLKSNIEDIFRNMGVSSKIDFNTISQLLRNCML